MVFLWFSYGFPMVFLWFSYGFPMVFLWFSYGFPMVFLWLSMHSSPLHPFPGLPATRAACACAASTAAGNRFATAVPDLSDQAGPYKSRLSEMEQWGKSWKNMGKYRGNHRKTIGKW